jgi:DNA ligase D-like protein (predicted ligase)
MECLPAEKLPEGSEWVYELKLDGFRAQAIRDATGIRLFSRNGKDYNRTFPLLVEELGQAIRHEDTAIDGELVALDEEGRPSFNALQNANTETLVIFFAFDVLTYARRDVKVLPLRDRLAILKTAVATSGHIQYSDRFPGPLSRFIKAVRDTGGEGIIAKRLSSFYESGKRSGAWQKMRLNMGQEFVIGGFVPGGNGVDALIVGFYDRKNLIYVARVRAGFVPSTRRDMFAKIKGLVIKECPFTNLPEKSPGRWGQGLTAKKMPECIWVKPSLVGQFEFLEWTGTNHVRHIKFVSLRDDKDPKKVVREI